MFYYQIFFVIIFISYLFSIYYCSYSFIVNIIERMIEFRKIRSLNDNLDFYFSGQSKFNLRTSFRSYLNLKYFKFLASPSYFKDCTHLPSDSMKDFLQKL